MAEFEIWSTDLFDREAAPSREGEYPNLLEGLGSLWKLVLEQGVQDDGKPTFTDFQLRISGKPAIFIPRDPSLNPELAQLRALRHRSDFWPTLAKLHLEQLGAPFAFGPFLAPY